MHGRARGRVEDHPRCYAPAVTIASKVVHAWIGSGLAVLLVAAGPSCGADPPPSGEGSTGTTSGEEESTGVTPMLAEPYGACAGPMASTECIDAGPEIATCIERNDPQGFPYSTCAVACFEDADCPLVGGNIPPECVGVDEVTPGLCLIDCPLGANSCAQGTLCVDGDPPLCMWPASIPGHPDDQSFCDTACGPCGATLLLPWSGDCVIECLADLADCSEPERAEIFACTGGEACPVGGMVVASCLEPIACVTGSA